MVILIWNSIIILQTWTIQGEWGAGPMRISPNSYKMLHETAIYAFESFSKNFWKYLLIWQ